MQERNHNHQHSEDYYNEGIACDVENCVYHDGEKHCMAEKIHVIPGHAQTTDETACDTFISAE